MVQLIFRAMLSGLSGGGFAYDTTIRDLFIQNRGQDPGQDPAGTSVLYAASAGAAGGLTALDLTTGQVARQIDQRGFDPGFWPRPDLGTFRWDGDSYLVSGGWQGGALRLLKLSATGGFDTLVGFQDPSGMFQDPSRLIALDMAGETYLLTAAAGGAGIGMFRLQTPAGQTQTELVYSGWTPDSADAYATSISAMATLGSGGQRWLFTASAGEHGVSSYRIDGTGLTLADSLGAGEGLAIATPTALATARTGGRDYLILASAGSSTLSVLRVGADGSLLASDQIIDNLDSRFANVSALETVTAGERVFVLAGGGDDGISLFTLLPDGRLLHLDSLADSTTTTLRNVSAIRALQLGDEIQVFVASASENGLTQFTLPTAAIGLTLAGGTGADDLTGGVLDDILSGGAGADTLAGGAGADILIDGPGRDRMQGGAGADVFVLSADGTYDRILDYQVGVDRLDLSGFVMLRTVAQLDITPTATGALLQFGYETIDITSADRQPLSAADFTTADILNLDRPPSKVVLSQGVFLGTPKADKLRGNFLDNTMNGGAGRDRIFGESGQDTLSGDAGHDRIFGGQGNDRIFGGAGKDILQGQAGRDRIFGGNGADILKGGNGRDILNGGNGDDLLAGGKGADRFIFRSGTDRIADFENDRDSIGLDRALWTGSLTPDQLLATFATSDGSDTYLDFGNGDMLVIENIGDPALLSDDFIFL